MEDKTYSGKRLLFSFSMALDDSVITSESSEHLRIGTQTGLLRSQNTSQPNSRSSHLLYLQFIRLDLKEALNLGNVYFAPSSELTRKSFLGFCTLTQSPIKHINSIHMLNLQILEVVAAPSPHFQLCSPPPPGFKAITSKECQCSFRSFQAHGRIKIGIMNYKKTFPV